MEIKVLEIRDRATFIPVMAIRPEGENEGQRYLLSRAGYGINPKEQAGYILLVHLQNNEIHYDSFSWKGGRTMTIAHRYIEKAFDHLKDGDVIDVEFILDETKKKKLSERYSNGED